MPAKTLHDLTPEDWGSLFPIKLVSYNEKWPKIFQKEKVLIEEKLTKSNGLKIEHFGSTSIPGLTAKPIIDILIEIPSNLLFDAGIIKSMEGIGYHYFKQTDNGEEYMIFVKGYHPDGTTDQLFHIHMCIQGHTMLEQLKFRDYLRKHSDRSNSYENLKLGLAQKFQNDRVGYRKAKTDFIKETMKFVEG